MKTRNGLLVPAIVCVSMFQMGMVALAPIVASLTEVFPGVSQLHAQTSTTFLNLILVLTALASGKISILIGRRGMAICGMALFILVGILGPVASAGLWSIYLWSAMLGMGTGLFVPAMSSLMMDSIPDADRSRVAGIQTAGVNLGGMLLSFFAGILAAGRWSRAYLVFLAAAAGLVLSILALPAKRENAKPAGKKLSGAVWRYTLETLVFAVIYFTFTTNISLLLAEKSGSTPAISGTATAVFMLGGCLFGFAFRKLHQYCGNRTAVVAFGLLALSYGAIGLVDSTQALLAASFVGGGSLSVIFPFCLMKLAEEVPPEQSVTAASFVLSVGPNLGSFLSPFLITGLAGLFRAESVSARFLIAAILSLVIGGLLLFLSHGRKAADISEQTM